MITRIFLFFMIAVAVGAVSTSCSEDIPDCPSRMCIVAGGWQLTEVYVDAVQDNSDLSLYRLVLNMPSPTTATTSGFDRIQPSGTSDEGTWSLENNDSILRLMPNDDPAQTEDWVIESMTPRKLVLVLTRDSSIKDGPTVIEFILEPF